LRTVVLKKGAERRASAGHLWIYSNEIEGFDRTIPSGDEVLVRDGRGGLLGTGTFSPASLISVRLHAPGRVQPLSSEWIEERVERAWANRRRWLGAGAESCRVFYAEGDGVPGVVADRFGEYLVLQCQTAAADRRRDALLDAFERTHSPAGILLRNDSPARGLEGLPQTVEPARGEIPDRVSFRLHGLSLEAEPRAGQKTGFFFDQRENYALLKPFCPGARVLDAFCYSGAWGLHAAAFGAERVTFVDASAGALELARANALANGFEGVEFAEADVLDFLKDAVRARLSYDVVVLDPPAFAKSRRQAEEAFKGYLNLNKWGMRAVRPGGALVTCSCSHHMPRDSFVELVARAARDAGREVRVLGEGRQSVDHPWIPAMPETAYLKALLLQVG
jgi:23S rRNA (cytosine1962-C5)-methyltransferase